MSRQTILCVEDEDELRRDLAEELAEAGYIVMEAANGREALMRLETLRPDLILCDISMPELNGFGLLRATLQHEADYAHIPFIFLSALADPREVIEGKLLGADDYLIKPIDYDLLLATVQARLRQVARIQRQPRAHLPVSSAALARLYGLTPTEARVAVALAQGKRPALIATELAIAPTTLAFHLRNIFQKTDTNRQSELVALLLTGPTAVD